MDDNNISRYFGRAFPFHTLVNHLKLTAKQNPKKILPATTKNFIDCSLDSLRENRYED